MRLFNQLHAFNMMRRLLLTAFVIAVAQTAVLADEPEEKAGEPEQKFQGFNLEGYSDNGEKSWEVNGDTADIQGTKIKLSNVNANSYGEEKVNVTAETGTIDQASGDMHLEKDVIITSERGTQLMTDSLDWDRNNDLVTTEDDVFITDEGLAVSGKGMKAQPGLKNAEIQEDVTVRVNPEKERDPSQIVTITSDGPMILDQANSRAEFRDNVVAVQLDRTLKADKLEIYFDQEKNTLKEIICIGHVEIIQGENKSFAERAVYNAEKQTVVLSGRPKMIMFTEDDDAFAAFGN